MLRMVINNKVVSSTVLMLLLAGCRAAAPLVRAEHTAIAQREAPGVTLTDLELGRQVLLRRCTGCHAVPTVRARSLASWSEELATMQGKAKLEPHEAQRLKAYLAVATQPDFVEAKDD